MTARVRKFIGLFGILGFLVAYTVIAATLGDYVPKHWAVQILYFAVVGTAWGIPLIPLVRWMNRPD